MSFPQLLVGKVAAITGGLTGIGRVSVPCVLQLRHPSPGHYIDRPIPGNCAGLH